MFDSIFESFERVGAKNANGFLPAWSRRERPIIVFNSNNLAICQNDNDLGIMDASGEVASFNRGAAALIFGDSPETLYFRANFSEIYKVDYVEDKKQMFEQLFNARLAVFCKCSESIIKTEGGLPVIRDPNELMQFFNHGSIPPNDPKKDIDSAEEEEDDDDCEEPFLREAWEERVQDQRAIEAAASTVLESHGVSIVARHRDFGKYGCDLDVAFLRGKCLLINYFCENGTWLPEEEEFGGDPPLYFSESDHCVSPVFVAKGFGDYFKERLKGGSVVTILVVSTGCEFLDEEKFVVIWRDNCHVEAVRTERVAGSQLESLHEYLDSLSAHDTSSALLDIEKVKAIDSDFAHADLV